MIAIERYRLPFIPVRIGARLYLLASMALATVVVLAAACTYFVSRSSDDVRDIRRLVQLELLQVNELELLLERHRRIIESAPVELDRDRIRQLRVRARDVIDEMFANVPDPAAKSGSTISETLSGLKREGERTLDLADAFAQEEAIRQVAVYVGVAHKIQYDIAHAKVEQMARFDNDVSRLIASGRALTGWVELGSAVALFLIGPFSLLVTRQIVRRLRAMTQTMLRLAENDTAVHVSGTRYRDELGDMARAMGVFTANAIELLEKQREVGTLNRRFKFALDNMSRGLSMFDSDRALIMCNARYGELYRLPDELVQPGTSFDAIIAHRIAIGTGRVGETAGQQRHPWPFDDQGDIGTDIISLTHELADGRIIQIAYQPIEGGGWVGLHEDATQERRQEARVERLARFDTVTNIPNRYSFQEHLDAALRQLPHNGGFAVLWIDLDRFNEVNDTFGHPTGDALLHQVATRLKNAVRTDDFVARLGGDEFAVIQTGIKTSADVDPLAQRLSKVLSEPYRLNSQTIEIGASVGAVLAPYQGVTPEELIRNADIALYQAKARGRGCHISFDATFVEQIKARKSLEADLWEAVRRQAFEVYYQPILDLRTGRVVVCEALLRWAHPTRGPVSPAVFIEVAEDIGAINELGAFALRRACADAVDWPDDIKVAVNLSAVQFARSCIFGTVGDALRDARLPPHRLELEITETVLMRDDTETLSVLSRLRQSGVSIALDDFGTGYSSLNYLRRFAFDKIKIDRSFIQDLPSRTECVAIVKAVADLAKTLGMETVAEGVETHDHMQRVAAAGCDGVQGYLISRPVPNHALRDAINTANAMGTVKARAA